MTPIPRFAEAPTFKEVLTHYAPVVREIMRKRTEIHEKDLRIQLEQRGLQAGSALWGYPYLFGQLCRKAGPLDYADGSMHNRIYKLKETPKETAKNVVKKPVKKNVTKAKIVDPKTINQLATYAATATSQHGIAIKAYRDSLAAGIAAGKALQAAHLLVKHGDWIPWLEKNVPQIGVRMAQEYRLAANNSAILDRLKKLNAQCDAHLNPLKNFSSAMKAIREEKKKAKGLVTTSSPAKPSTTPVAASESPPVNIAQQLRDLNAGGDWTPEQHAEQARLNAEEQVDAVEPEPTVLEWLQGRVEKNRVEKNAIINRIKGMSEPDQVLAVNAVREISRIMTEIADAIAPADSEIGVIREPSVSRAMQAPKRETDSIEPV